LIVTELVTVTNRITLPASWTMTDFKFPSFNLTDAGNRLAIADSSCWHREIVARDDAFCAQSCWSRTSSGTMMTEFQLWRHFCAVRREGHAWPSPDELLKLPAAVQELLTEENAELLGGLPKRHRMVDSCKSCDLVCIGWRRQRPAAVRPR
jgi:hypothetical protein